MIRHALIALAGLAAVACGADNNESAQDSRAQLEQNRSDVSRGLRNNFEGDGWPWTAQERLTEFNAPGVAVAIIENFEVVDVYAFGHWRNDSDAPMRADALFQFASNSKMITAILVMRAHEQGLIDIKAPVNDYLKQWELQTTENARSDLTIAHLLNHTGSTTTPGFPGFRQDEELATLLQILNGEPPAKTPRVVVDGPPLESARYSGGGYQVLQAMLEDVYGKPFDDIAQEQVFVPLSMKDSNFRPYPADSDKELIAPAHDSNGAPYDGGYYLEPSLAAGGVWSTVSDMALLLKALMSAYNGEEDAILSSQSVQTMIENSVPLGWMEYGYGLNVERYGNQVYVGHGGSNEGYQSNTIANLAKGYGAVAVSNGDSGHNVNAELFFAIADVHGWEKFRPISDDCPVGYLKRSPVC